ncbi:unnamed protein product, partial [Iphiclides podalirius]
MSLKDSIMTSFNAQEPWPENVKLFQPYEVEQILLPDNASCLAVQAFLKMCNLPFEVEMRWNAEFMSPSGRVPFIKCGAFVVSELEPIVQFAANKGVTLCGRLSTEEKAEMRAYMSLITNVLVNAELYISWVDPDTFNAVTRIRNASVYPWPLGWIQTRSKRNNVIKRLKALHWYDKTLDQVLADVEQCCNSLSQRLGERDYFFGTPTPLDALAYGHIRAILSANGPKAAMMIKPITSALLRHLMRMTNLTRMPLTPQEDYLLSQATQISLRKRVPFEMSTSKSSTRVKRSKMCVSVKSPCKHLVPSNSDVFGFKPFASKQIIIMTSEGGKISCECDGALEHLSINNESFAFMVEIVDEILAKVDEITAIMPTSNVDRGDFVLIPCPNANDECNYPDYENMNEYLETIAESDLTNTTSSADEDDVAQIINDDEIDSDGLVNDKHLSGNVVANDNANFAHRPTELDALVFGHVFTIITTRLPCRKLADIVRRHETLVTLAKRIDEQYFKRP